MFDLDEDWFFFWCLAFNGTNVNCIFLLLVTFIVIFLVSILPNDKKIKSSQRSMELREHFGTLVPHFQVLLSWGGKITRVTISQFENQLVKNTTMEIKEEKVIFISNATTKLKVFTIFPWLCTS